MPNRDTYKIAATVRDDYEDEPHWTFTHEEYLTPGQDKETTMASVMRSAALKLEPEGGDQRSEEAIFAVLDMLRASALADRSDTPATRALLIGQLWNVAESLGLLWYGAR